MPFNSKTYNIIQSSITDQELDVYAKKTEQYEKNLKAMLLKTIIY